ncbi:MAG: SCO family protein [Arenimonas sp.]|nr:SCO family protein [Arenimonas sp.]
MKTKIILVVLAFILVVLPAKATLPTDSVWQLKATITEQNAKSIPLKDLAGKPRLVSMFYSSCPYMCPLIIDTALAVQHDLSAQEREKLGVLMISIDPKKDTPQVLQALMAKRKLDPTQWILARASEQDVRSIAALLNIRYRQLEGGDFNHTSVLILIDAQGRIVARTEKMGTQPEPEFLVAVHKLLQ